ncbi:amino acid ABC transporter substrate-binding protein, PAAT family [Friedmanniella luteola]|uniref:Amino acid ABC transporter substrate-binding protein, PAAT family n=1 Tax=Friedmanniella luteola TaxID=546871 RepID=A0A1H1LXL0_9ACTN|nr:ABC transporter substrate-binding protein [Friedmanniella luteola]SDR79231.1 amino acid ABC transporter substrate-binding protein, PAAT family [Friedmanniella luteola]
MLRPHRLPAPRLAALGLAAALALAVTACAPEDETAAPQPAAGSSASSAAACSQESLSLVTDGQFTVGTDKPAYEPWFSDDDPTNGKGYESAVTYAVAEQLGFSRDEVSWITVPFTNAYAPGDKKFDVDINQVSITEARRKAVDFSSGYYDVAQAVVTTADSPIAGATTLAALKTAKLGAQVGTTSYTAIQEQIQPEQQAAVYDTNDLAVQALKNGQIDGLVVDLPTAFYAAAAQLDDGKIVGQLPPGSGTTDQFGFVLAKGSALTACVSAAVDALRADGTLETIEGEYLSNAGGAPLLQ